MSRRSRAPELTIISWRDIPAQITARSGARTVKHELAPRFQTAIDRAAMRASLHDTDGYLAEWRRTSRVCDDDLEQAVSEEAERIERRFTTELLNATAENGGFLDQSHPAQPNTEHP